jgi:hypothetical protein
MPTAYRASTRLSWTARVVSPGQVTELRDRLDAGIEGVVLGSLVEGGGGFNESWSWLLDPSTVRAADTSIELCDGRPSMVEENLAHRLDAVGAFCPWGARVVGRVR